MNEIELAIYRHLSGPFRDLMDTFREKSPQSTFDQAMKWTAAVLVQEQKLTDKYIAEMTLEDEGPFLPIGEVIEKLEERNGI